MDLFPDDAPPPPKVHPGRKVTGRLESLLVGDLAGFETRPVERADMTFEGMAGDGHAGFTRKAGGREPWYPRGTEIRSGRQLSILSTEDLAAVAAELGLDAVDPAVIGGNLVISNVPNLSFLPAGTRLFFEGGASAVVEGQNAPCRYAGKALAERHPGRDDLELAFVAAAKRRRGVVASVERPGTVTAGTAVSVKIPEQWIWA
jgi:hypothetical protein